MRIFHIVLAENWEKYKEKEFYEDESLRSEGFIHCSFANQLGDVLKRHYDGVEKVLILEIETEKLTSKLINEPSANDEIYPHIYGKINLHAIVRAEEKILV